MRPLFLVNRVLRAPDSKKIMLDHPFTTAGSQQLLVEPSQCGKRG
jgi:hypothetical protein